MAIIDMVGDHSYLYGSSNNTDKVVEMVGGLRLTFLDQFQHLVQLY